MDGVTNTPKTSKQHVNQLSLMRRHQDWVKMHCGVSIDPTVSEAYQHFDKMVRGMLTDEKYKMFNSLLRWPLPSNEVTAVVFDRLSRVFEGRNPVFDYQFHDTTIADDWNWYRHERLHEPDLWREIGWRFFRTEPNSIIVVDMPTEREKGDKYPQPYAYWVTLDDIVDYGSDGKGHLTWVLFKDDNRRKAYFIDDKVYRVWNYPDEAVMGLDWLHIRYDENGELYTDIEADVTNPHKLGYIPAKWFLDDPVDLSTPDVKKSPVTDVLEKLDWWLFFNTSKRHLDTYGAYPIYATVEPQCSYEEELEIGEKKIFAHCEGGILVEDDGKPVMIGGVKKKCPRCGEHPLTGPGTLITRPMPNSESGVPDIRNVVQILSVDKESLDYNTGELERLRKDIISQCVGIDNDMISDFSVSDAQIAANYESQGTILIRVKRELEAAQKFVDTTCIDLRYGKDSYESITVNYGTEFYTLSTEQLRKRYKEAKESGASESDLMALRKQIIETEYRNNPTEQQRMFILTDVEPLASMSVGEAMTRWQQGLVDDTDMKVKANFAGLMRRFERENGNIIFFAESKPYYEKIDIIKQKLNDYVKGIEPRTSDPAGVPPVAPGAGQREEPAEE